MDLGLEGKVAWVLGASSGLGRACATSLAAEGVAVALSARRPEPLRAVADDIEGRGGRTFVAPLDVADTAAIPTVHSQIAEALGPVDILIANSGGPPPGRFDDLDTDGLETGFAVTAGAAWHLSKAVRPGMKGRGGCLVFITSWSAKEPIPGLLLSNLFRPGVVGLAKTLSQELGGEGIRVLCIAPGRIKTPRVDELDNATAARTGRSVEDIRAASEATIPLGRYGRPEEIGDVVAFLASERASYLTGVTISIDGGLVHGLLS